MARRTAHAIPHTPRSRLHIPHTVPETYHKPHYTYQLTHDKRHIHDTNDTRHTTHDTYEITSDVALATSGMRRQPRWRRHWEDETPFGHKQWSGAIHVPPPWHCGWHSGTQGSSAQDHPAGVSQLPLPWRQESVTTGAIVHGKLWFFLHRSCRPSVLGVEGKGKGRREEGWRGRGRGGRKGE